MRNLLATLETLVASEHPEGIAGRLDVLYQDVMRQRGDLTEAEAFRLLDTLTVAGQGEGAALIAEALWRGGKKWTFLDRTIAQALIERGQYRAAQAILSALASPSLVESAFCAGQMGRLHKSLHHDLLLAGDTDSAEAALEQAIESYNRAIVLAGRESPEAASSEVVEHQYRAWRWGVTNLLALLPDTEPNSVRRKELADTLIHRALARTTRNSFDDSAIGAAYLALRMPKVAAEAYLEMMGRAECSSGQMHRVLRDMDRHRSEAVQQSDEMLAVKFALQSELLKRMRGSIVLTKQNQIALSHIGQQLTKDESMRQSPHAHRIAWLESGISKADSVARVLDPDRPNIEGSAFLVAGHLFGAPEGQDLLVTCAHVLSSKGRDDSISKTNAVVRFEKLGLQYRIGKILFESGRGRLDVTVATLAGDPEAMRRLNALPSHTDNLDPEKGRGGYTIGHPLGDALSLVLGPARFVGHSTEYHSNAQFYSYTTDTRPGNSGGPVFDNQWRAVAVHQLGPTQSLADAPCQGLAIGTLVTQASEEILRNLG